MMMKYILLTAMVLIGCASNNNYQINRPNYGKGIIKGKNIFIAPIPKSCIRKTEQTLYQALTRDYFSTLNETYLGNFRPKTDVYHLIGEDIRLGQLSNILKKDRLRIVRLKNNIQRSESFGIPSLESLNRLALQPEIIIFISELIVQPIAKRPKSEEIHSLRVTAKYLAWDYGLKEAVVHGKMQFRTGYNTDDPVHFVEPIAMTISTRLANSLGFLH